MRTTGGKRFMYILFIGQQANYYFREQCSKIFQQSLFCILRMSQSRLHEWYAPSLAAALHPSIF